MRSAAPAGDWRLRRALPVLPPCCPPSIDIVRPTVGVQESWKPPLCTIVAVTGPVKSAECEPKDSAPICPTPALAAGAAPLIRHPASIRAEAWNDADVSAAATWGNNQGIRHAAAARPGVPIRDFAMAIIFRRSRKPR